MGFLDARALEAMGFKSLGEDVKVSDKCSIYNAAQIEIGDHSRVDDFCVLSAGAARNHCCNTKQFVIGGARREDGGSAGAGAGGIRIGAHVHVAVFASLMGAGRIELRDFSGVPSGADFAFDGRVALPRRASRVGALPRRASRKRPDRFAAAQRSVQETPRRCPHASPSTRPTTTTSAGR